MDNPNNQVTLVNFFFNSNKHILYNKVMTYKIANVPHLLHGVVIFGPLAYLFGPKCFAGYKLSFGKKNHHTVK